MRAALQVLLLYVFLCLVITAFPGFTNDVRGYQRWCLHIQQSGLAQAYDADTDYPPLLHYFLWLFGKIFHSELLIEHYFYYFRSLVLLFDFLGLYLVYKWADTGLRYLHLLFYALILNIAFCYDTIIWGQTDAIGPALTFAALYMAYHHRFLLSAILCLLALNMKLQMIVFLPIWGLVALHGIIRMKNWKMLLLVPMAMAVAETLLLLPFLCNDNRPDIGHMLFGNFGEMPSVCIHAHNLWYLIFGDASREMNDNLVTNIGVSYRKIGLILFFITSALALAPLVKQLWMNKNAHINKMLIWQTGALISLLFFFLNTEMHERYSHPALLFLAAIAFHTRRFGLLTICSFAYFWNLELYMQAFKWPYFIYGSPLVGGYIGALLFAVLIVVLFADIYRRKNAVVTA